MLKGVASFLIRLALLVLMVLCVAQPGFAAGRMLDFDSGSLAVGYGQYVKLYGGNEDESVHYDASLQVGISGKMALQARQARFGDDNETLRATRAVGRELNLIYKFDPHFGVYVGAGSSKIRRSSDGATTDANRFLQYGVIGARQLSSKGVLYTVLGVGSRVENVEFGYTHAVSKGLDIEIAYRHLKTKHNMLGSVSSEAELRGFSAGLVCYFK